jgi:hypothetical protein
MVYQYLSIPAQLIVETGLRPINALSTPESTPPQCPAPIDGKATFRPNPSQRRNYLRGHNLQCDERVDPSATT